LKPDKGVKDDSGEGDVILGTGQAVVGIVWKLGEGKLNSVLGFLLSLVLQKYTEKYI
jgi:hypothetical protein